MIDIKRHTYIMGNYDFRMVMFGDLHYTDCFNDKKLDVILKGIRDSDPLYVLIAGDLIDGTDFLYSNKEKKERLLDFLRVLGRDYKVFITRGNHDLAKRRNGKVKDLMVDFWSEVSLIPGVFLSCDKSFYEDDRVIIYMLELDFEYYYNDKGESIEILKDKLDKDKKLFSNMDKNKVKIVICHSPVYMEDVSSYFRDFDFIFSGHMHNGMVTYFCDKLIKGNRGIISPSRRLFPDYTRGVRDITIDGNVIHLIINGGITKLSYCSGIFRYFNFVYPISMNNIVINKEK